MAFKEFVVAQGFKIKGKTKDDTALIISTVFDLFDSDGSGSISRDELLEFFSFLFEAIDLDGKPENLVNELMKKHDKDNSNSIDRQEFVGFFLQEGIVDLLIL